MMDEKYNVFLGDVLTERKEIPKQDGLLTGKVPIIEKIKFSDGQIHFRRASTTKTNMILIRSGDLVLSGINAAKGAIAIYDSDDPIAATIHYSSYIPNTDKVNVKYLWWFLRSKVFQNILKKYIPGGIKTEVRPKNFLKIPLNLPPLNVQNNIVEKIVKFVNDLNKMKRNKKYVNDNIISLIKMKKNKIFNDIGIKWGVKKLDELININMGQSPPGESYNSLGFGIPLLNGPTEFGKKYPTPIQWTTSPTKLCKKGDILLCVRGATTGKMNWADQEYCIGRGLAALSPNPEAYESEFVFYFIETQTQKMFDLASGSTFPNLSSKKLKKLMISNPPLDEQKKIINYVNRLQEEVKILDKLSSNSADKIEMLEQSLFYQIFRNVEPK